MILSINEKGATEWWFDTSFVVHDDDMRSRIGMSMNLGNAPYTALQLNKS